MRRICQLALVLMALCASGHAATCPASTNTQAAIVSAIAGCTSGNTVTLPAGTYSISSSIALKCGVGMQGPAGTLSYQTRGSSVVPVYSTSAILSATGRTFPIFTLSNCTTAVTVQGIQFLNASAMFLTGPVNNLTFTQNACYNLPGGEGNNGSCIYAALGHNASPLGPNVTYSWNDVGDANSCLTPTNVMMKAQPDQGGLCNGFMEKGQINGLTIVNNSFYHLENGANKIVCDGTTSTLPCEGPSKGGNNSPFTNVVVANNNLDSIHRAWVEEQGGPGVGLQNVNNSFQHILNSNKLSIGVSMPCCTDSTTTPGQITSNNVQTNSEAPNSGDFIAFAQEFWGWGAQSRNNLIQGYFRSGISWGFGYNSWDITSNTMQLSGVYAGNASSLCTNPPDATPIGSPLNNGYIANEECANQYSIPGPVNSGNMEGTAIAQQTSAAPSISISGGTATLTDPGFTSGSLPTGNTSIWYTTDGSTPVPGTAHLYASPFAVSPGATVKAVGMWGTGGNTVSYASPYGFVPSAVISATAPSGLYISPTGNDSNSGSSSSPWLTPNHALTCGQVITALPGTYSASNFGSGHWGTVNCPAANDVAWLKCQTFDTCKITSTSSDGMWVSKSFWGIQGWEISVTGGTNGACFHAGPTSGTIHHIIFANNVANGCMGGGFNAYDVSTSSSVDYIVYIGNVAYNAASGTGACYSGFNIYQPIASDANAGTHMYIAGNFSYDNVDGSPCSGGLTTDGEGINLDTFDFSQGGGSAYTQQAVVQNNISVSNGSSGILMENNKVGGSAPTYFKNNTTYGNLKATNRSFCTGLGEIYAEAAYSVTESNNLSQTNAATGCMGAAIYANSVANGNGTVTVAVNWINGTGGNNTFISSSPGFSYGANTIGINPAFTSTTVPGAPACSGTANVPACMAAMVSNFTPTASGSGSFGYQLPSNTSITDSLFPQWLCAGTGVLNPNIPAGLITPGCGGGTAPTLTGGAQTNSGLLNHLAVGAPAIQQFAVGTYSDGLSHGNLPDAYGNTAVWSSANPAILSVSPTGQISCVATGTGINSQVVSSPGGVHFNPWTWTCTPAAPGTVNGVTVIVITKNGGIQ